MHSPQQVSRGIGERGIGGKKIALEPGIQIIPFPGDAFAIWAHLVRNSLSREEVSHTTPNEQLRIPAQEMTQTQVTPQNPSLAIMNQDRVSNGIESVSPLLLNGGYLFEEPYVL